MNSIPRARTLRALVAAWSRGQSTVEFALISIPLFMLVMGIFDLGRAVYHNHMIGNAVREGARVGITVPNPPPAGSASPEEARARHACDIVVRKAFLPNITESPCTWDGGSQTASFNTLDLSIDVFAGVQEDPAQPLRISLSYGFKLITPLISNITGSLLTLRASSTMYVESSIALPPPGPTPTPNVTPTPVPPTPPPGSTATFTPVATATPSCVAGTVITVTAATGTYGGTVTLNANVKTSGGSNVSGATVSFYVNGTFVGSDTTPGNGNARVNNVSLGTMTAGLYTDGIEARYCGSSGRADLTINKATTTTSADNKTVANDATEVTLTATVSSTSSPPINEGLVTFTVTGAGGFTRSVISNTVSPGGASAVMSLSGMGIGNYSVAASYSGGPNFLASSDATPGTLSVKQSTALVVSPASGVYGGTVNLSATLTAGGSPLVGHTITFMLNGTSVGTAVTGAGGVATRSANLGAIAVGSYPGGVTASFAGDATYAPSNDTDGLTVSKASSSTDAADRSVPYSATSVSLTAAVVAVSPSTAVVNEGTVSFVIKSGATTVGTPPAPVPVASGSAGVAYPLPANLAIGTYTIEGTYSGGTNFNGSADLLATLTVTKANTTTAPAAATAVVDDTSVVLTAQVTANTPATAVVNQGSVTFVVRSGATVIGSPVTSVDPISGPTASVTYPLPPGTPAGTYTVEATYSGGTNFNGSVGTNTLTITLKPTTLVAGPDPLTRVYGDLSPATVTATLTSSGSPLSGRAIAFTVNGTAVGTQTTNASGVATLAGVSLAGTNVGSYASGIQASFAGDAFYQPTSDGATLTIIRADTTTATANQTVPFGATITLTASVTAVSPSSAVVNQGTVSFRVRQTGGGVEIGSCRINNVAVANGIATTSCNIGTAPLGNYRIEAAYGGGSNFNGSTASFSTLTIVKADTTSTPGNVTVTLAASGSTSVPLSATVIANSPSTAAVNQGAVTFSVSSGGAQPTPAAVNGSGVANATYSLPAGTAAGTYTVQATYGGGTNFNASLTGTATLTVSKRPTALTAGAVTATYGGPAVTLTATLTDTTSGSPVALSGKSVSFTLNGIVVGSATTNASGVASLAGVSIAGIDAGVYATGVGASFVGDSIYQAASGANSLTVPKAGTATNAANAAADTGDTTVTLSATVVALAPSTATVEAGTVTFTVRQGGATVGTPVTGAVSGGAASATFDLTGVSAGTYTIEASYGGAANFDPSSDATPATLTVARQGTTLAVTAVNGTYGGTVTLTATLSSDGVPLSGYTVDFSLNGSAAGSATTDAFGVATLTGVPLSATNAGTYPSGVAASFAGDGTYLATNNTGALTVSPASTSTDAGNASGTSGGSVALTASVSSSAAVGAGTVTFTVKQGGSTIGSPVSGGVSSGAASATFSLSGVAAGTYDVEATYGGSANFDPSSDQTPGILTVTTQATSLSAADASGMYGATTTLSATLASGRALSGYTVSFTLNGNAVGQATTNGNGVATLSGVSLGGINAGAYSGAVAASFAGDGFYQPASNSAWLTVSKADQTISFGALANKTYGDVPFMISASASSSLPVTFFASGDCSVDVDQVTILGAGSCTIMAVQSGDSNYNAAPNVFQSFTIAKANQTISFGALGNKTYGDAPFAVSASASSGLSVSFGASGNCSVSGGTVTITNVGSCTITAFQAGDSNYNAAPNVPQTFSIAPASATISLDASTLNPTFDGAQKVVTATTNPAGLTYSVTYDGSSTPPTSAGSYSIVATITDPNYAGSTSGTLTIAKANQTISFGSLGSKTYGDAPFAVSASASSGLSVSFGASGNCSVSGSTVTVSGAGSCTITASQAGNANYNAASDVPQTFAINEASATVTLGDLTHTYDGGPKYASASTSPTGLTVMISYSQGGTPVTDPTDVGSYDVAATISDPNYQGSAAGTLAIN